MGKRSFLSGSSDGTFSIAHAMHAVGMMSKPGSASSMRPNVAIAPEPNSCMRMYASSGAHAMSPASPATGSRYDEHLRATYEVEMARR